MAGQTVSPPINEVVNSSQVSPFKSPSKKRKNRTKNNSPSPTGKQSSSKKKRRSSSPLKGIRPIKIRSESGQEDDGKPRMTTEEIMNILTESQKNEIKRNIGNVFRKVLLQAEVKLILMKQPINRTEREIDRVVFFL